jgi:hypothetical protein
MTVEDIFREKGCHFFGQKKGRSQSKRPKSREETPKEGRQQRESAAASQ